MTKSKLLLSTAAIACGFSMFSAGTASAALVCAAGTCSATQLVSTTTTNFTGLLNFDKFDPTAIVGGATLTSVTYTMGGNVTGSAKAESLDAAPASIVLTLLATLTASRPSAGAVVTTILPTVVQNFNATAFDGAIDFLGTSGTTLTGLLGAASPVSVTLTSGADLALFTGAGTVNVPYAGVGSSTGTGAGNLITQFATQGDLSLTIVYNYTTNTNEVPEPASLAVLGLGLSAVGFIRRRRGN